MTTAVCYLPCFFPKCRNDGTLLCGSCAYVACADHREHAAPIGAGAGRVHHVWYGQKSGPLFGNGMDDDDTTEEEPADANTVPTFVNNGGNVTLDQRPAIKMITYMLLDWDQWGTVLALSRASKNVSRYTLEAVKEHPKNPATSITPYARWMAREMVEPFLTFFIWEQSKRTIDQSNQTMIVIPTRSMSDFRTINLPIDSEFQTLRVMNISARVLDIVNRLAAKEVARRQRNAIIEGTQLSEDDWILIRAPLEKLREMTPMHADLFSLVPFPVDLNVYPLEDLPREFYWPWVGNWMMPGVTINPVGVIDNSIPTMSYRDYTTYDGPVVGGMRILVTDVPTGTHSAQNMIFNFHQRRFIKMYTNVLMALLYIGDITTLRYVMKFSRTRKFPSLPDPTGHAGIVAPDARPATRDEEEVEGANHFRKANVKFPVIYIEPQTVARAMVKLSSRHFRELFGPYLWPKAVVDGLLRLPGKYPSDSDGKLFPIRLWETYRKGGVAAGRLKRRILSRLTGSFRSPLNFIDSPSSSSRRIVLPFPPAREYLFNEVNVVHLCANYRLIVGATGLARIRELCYTGPDRPQSGRQRSTAPYSIMGALAEFQQLSIKDMGVIMSMGFNIFDGIYLHDERYRADLYFRITQIISKLPPRRRLHWEIMRISSWFRARLVPSDARWSRLPRTIAYRDVNVREVTMDLFTKLAEKLSLGNLKAFISEINAVRNTFIPTFAPSSPTAVAMQYDWTVVVLNIVSDKPQFPLKGDIIPWVKSTAISR